MELSNYATGGHAWEQDLHLLWRAKDLFSSINLHVKDSVGGAKPCKMFHLGAMPPVLPAGTWLSFNVRFIL